MNSASAISRDEIDFDAESTLLFQMLGEVNDFEVS